MRFGVLFVAAAAVLLISSTAFAAKPVCGDGVQRGSEDCDGPDLAGETCGSLGFTGGALACSAGCSFDTSSCTVASAPVCGDGVVEAFEECDGAADGPCPGACSAQCACPSMPPGDLWVDAIDVGQGDSIVVVSPDGFVMLVDSGTEGEAGTVEAYLTSVGITGIDYTLVSHMDADHVGGMDVVLTNHPEVAACFDHGGAVGTGEYAEYDATAGACRWTLQDNDTIDLGPSMTAEVLHSHTTASIENNNSVVVRLTYGDTTFLLGGDCEAGCEADYDPGPIQVYKVHHHGSQTSSGAAFLAQMDPWTGLISVGAGNAFGHPHQSVLDRLAIHETTVYRTDLDGDLAVRSDGTAYTVNGAPVCSGVETRTCGTSDVGACSYGAHACVGGMWDPTCAGAVDPVAEDCTNGLDDDCDGLVDAADPSCGSSPADVLLVQVAYDTPGTDAIEEFVDLYNRSSSPVTLDGWTLMDNAGSWTIPAGTTIAAGDFLSFARDVAGFEALYLESPDVCCFGLGLGNSGDVLTLVDELGAVVDEVAWGDYLPGWSIDAATGDSIARPDPSADTDSVADWAILSPADPEAEPIVGGSCGDGTCGAGESCDGRSGTQSCPSDCPGVTGGKPSNRYCFVEGVCTGPGCP